MARKASSAKDPAPDLEFRRLTERLASGLPPALVVRGEEVWYRHQAGLRVAELAAESGLEVCRHLKRDPGTASIPLMMITAKDAESDVVLGLELGADDYVSKPFSPREVLARVRAILRRGTKPAESGKSRVEAGPLVLDRERYEVRVDDELLDMTRAEFRLLWALVSQPGRVFARDELIEYITAGEALIGDRNVDVHISALRKKLGDHGGLIQTVRGVGYKCRDLSN